MFLRAQRAFAGRPCVIHGLCIAGVILPLVKAGECGGTELAPSGVAEEVNSVRRGRLNAAVELGVNGDPHFSAGLLLG
jgi:hypothetical protein